MALEFGSGGGTSAEIDLLSTREILEEDFRCGHGAQKMNPFPATRLLQRSTAQAAKIAFLMDN